MTNKHHKAQQKLSLKPAASVSPWAELTPVALSNSSIAGTTENPPLPTSEDKEDQSPHSIPLPFTPPRRTRGTSTHRSHSNNSLFTTRYRNKINGNTYNHYDPEHNQYIYREGQESRVVIPLDLLHQAQQAQSQAPTEEENQKDKQTTEAVPHTPQRHPYWDSEDPQKTPHSFPRFPRHHHYGPFNRHNSQPDSNMSGAFYSSSPGGRSNASQNRGRGGRNNNQNTHGNNNNTPNSSNNGLRRRSNIQLNRQGPSAQNQQQNLLQQGEYNEDGDFQPKLPSDTAPAFRIIEKNRGRRRGGRGGGNVGNNGGAGPSNGGGGRGRPRPKDDVESMMKSTTAFPPLGGVENVKPGTTKATFAEAAALNSAITTSTNGIVRGGVVNGQAKATNGSTSRDNNEQVHEEDEEDDDSSSSASIISSGILSDDPGPQLVKGQQQQQPQEEHVEFRSSPPIQEHILQGPSQAPTPNDSFDQSEGEEITGALRKPDDNYGANRLTFATLHAHNNHLAARAANLLGPGRLNSPLFNSNVSGEGNENLLPLSELEPSEPVSPSPQPRALPFRGNDPQHVVLPSSSPMYGQQPSAGGYVSQYHQHLLHNGIANGGSPLFQTTNIDDSPLSSPIGVPGLPMDHTVNTSIDTAMATHSTSRPSTQVHYQDAPLHLNPLLHSSQQFTQDVPQGPTIQTPIMIQQVPIIPQQQHQQPVQDPLVTSFLSSADIIRRELERHLAIQSYQPDLTATLLPNLNHFRECYARLSVAAANLFRVHFSTVMLLYSAVERQNNDAKLLGALKTMTEDYDQARIQAQHERWLGYTPEEIEEFRRIGVEQGPELIDLTRWCLRGGQMGLRMAGEGEGVGERFPDGNY